jgi:hypothetical protein
MKGIIMDEQKIDRILRNAKTSMEIEGFTIDDELEEIGRKILRGEVNLRDYIEQVKREAIGQNMFLISAKQSPTNYWKPT